MCGDGDAELTDGAQAIRRAAAAIKAVASRGPAGAALATLVDELGLTRTTATRILKSLVGEGLLSQDTGTRHYIMGPALQDWALHAVPFASIVAHGQRALQRIAARTEDTVYLVMRAGVDVISLCHVDATSAVRVVTPSFGRAYPIGATAAGVAMLAALPQDEAEALLDRTAAQILDSYGVARARILPVVASARAEGFAHFENFFIEGAASISMLVPGSPGLPTLAFSTTSVVDRMSGARMEMIVGLMRDEGQALAEALRGPREA